MSNPFIIGADMSRSITPELLKGLQGFVAFINDGTDIEAIFDLAGALLKLPEDSLGFAYTAHMRAVKLNLEFYRPIELQDDASYLTL